MLQEILALLVRLNSALDKIGSGLITADQATQIRDALTQAVTKAESLTGSGGGQLPTPTLTPNVTNITNAGALISWVTSDQSDSQVEYGLTTTYGTQSPVTDTAPMVATHHVLLSGLKPSTGYNYRVRSKNAVGTLSISANGTFDTIA